MWRAVRFIIISLGLMLAFLAAAFFDGKTETSLLAMGVGMILLPILTRRFTRG